MAGLDLIGPTFPPNESFLQPQPRPVKNDYGQPQGMGSAGSNYVYQDSASIPPSGSGDSYSQIYDDLLAARAQYAPNPAGVSSTGGSGGGTDWGKLLYGVGLTLASGSAGSRGDFSLPMQHMQMLQQQEQLKRVAEDKKQAYALQLQKFNEEKNQHQWKQVFDTLGNDKLSIPQQMELIKGMKDNPHAVSAAQNLNEKLLGQLNANAEYMAHKPQEYMQALQSGKMSMHDLVADIQAAEPIKKAILEKKASAKAYQSMQRMASENPDDPAIQEAWQEMQAEKQKKIIDNKVAQESAPSTIQSSILKPAQQVADIQHKLAGSEDRSTFNRLAEDLMGRPWKDLSQAEKHMVTQYEQSREVQKQEAGARAREQVKTETNLSPGVMIHKQMTDMVQNNLDMFADEKAGMTGRLKQMASARAKYFTGDEHMRQWSQMEDGMRATLARMAMEVGNLAATEQDRAKQLVPDVYGSFYGVPDSREVATAKLKLLGEFLKAGLEGPQGPDAESRVQEKLRGTLAKLDQVAPLPAVGELSPEEYKAAQAMKEQGMDKRAVQAAILKQRNMK